VSAILNLRCDTRQGIIDYLGFSRGLSMGAFIDVDLYTLRTAYHPVNSRTKIIVPIV